MGAPPCYLKKGPSKVESGLLLRSFVPDTRLIQMEPTSIPDEYCCLPFIGISAINTFPLYLASLEPSSYCWGEARDVSALVLWKGELFGITLHHFEVVNDE